MGGDISYYLFFKNDYDLEMLVVWSLWLLFLMLNVID